LNIYTHLLIIIRNFVLAFTAIASAVVMLILAIGYVINAILCAAVAFSFIIFAELVASAKCRVTLVVNMAVLDYFTAQVVSNIGIVFLTCGASSGLIMVFAVVNRGDTHIGIRREEVPVLAVQTLPFAVVLFTVVDCINTYVIYRGHLAVFFAL